MNATHSLREPLDVTSPNIRTCDSNTPRDFLKRVDIRASAGRQIDLPLTFITTDSSEHIPGLALIDSGCSQTSIDHSFVKKHRLTTVPSAVVVPIYNADGSLNGHIKEYVILVLVIRDAAGREHRERRDFPVVNLAGKHGIFLGYDWLEQHNPDVNWRDRALSFTRCPEACRMNSGGYTPAPLLPVDAFADADLPTILDYLNDFHTAERGEYIRAFQSISTRIETEADAKKAVEIPPVYSDFADVFEKKEFDKLPPHRRWDHEINLKSGWQDDRKMRGRVYPLSPREQAAMDEFLDENLRTGRIRPSNSPIAAPFFFVGKKDGGLRPTQDYRRLNHHTV